jgi:hypothetical protein
MDSILMIQIFSGGVFAIILGVLIQRRRTMVK